MRHLPITIIVLLILVGGAAGADQAETCRQKLIKAQQLGVLYDLDWKPGKMPKVIVGPTFHQMPLDAKEGFVETVNCFLLGGKSGAINFDVKEHLNHRVVGSWTYGRYKPKE